MLRDLLDDETRRDRRAVIVQHGDQARRIDLALIDQQGLQLGVAVLLDHEHPGVGGDEVRDLVLEREGPDAQRVDVYAALGQHVECFLHRGTGRAVVDGAEPRRLGRGREERLRHQRLGGIELAHQALHVVDVVRTGLAVARVAVLGGAAGEVGAPRRMRAGIGAVRDAVAVHVEVAPELLARF